MFTELMPLLRKRRLLLTISLIEGDTIRATVVPQKASDTEDNALTTPIGNHRHSRGARSRPSSAAGGIHWGAPATSNYLGFCQSRNGSGRKGGSRRGTQENPEAIQRDESCIASDTGGTHCARARGALAVCPASAVRNGSHR